MLATKNRAGRSSILFLALLVSLAGCKPPGPRALLDGKRLIESGKYPEAIEKLKVATSLLSTNGQAWNYLGLAYHRAGQPTNAAVAYQKALLLNRDLLEARFNLGCLWLDENQPEAAKNELIAYTLRRGNEAEGWLKLGAAQLRLREATAAEKSFHEAQRVSPQNVEALNGLGLVQLQRNRPREAVQFFSDALKQRPDYAPALLNLATVLQQQLNDRAGALQKYREYLALKPAPPDFDGVKALVQSLEPPVVPAPRPPPTNIVAAHVTPATNLPKQTTVTVARVPAPTKTPPPPVVARHKPEISPAPTTTVEVVQLPPEPIIKSALDTVPVSTDTNAEPTAVAPVTTVEEPPSERRGFFSRINPVNIFRHEQKPAAVTALPETSTNTTSAVSDAAKPVNEPVEILPSSPLAAGDATSFSRYTYLSPSKPAAGNRHEAERSFWQAQQAQRANRPAAAAQAYRQATVMDPQYFEAYYNLGLIAYESRSYRQALTIWENALALQPDSTDARYNFALALKAASYPIDAANELEKLLAANPNEPRAHLVLGNLYAEQFGNASRARAHYLKVLELDPRNPQATAIRYWLVAHPPPG